MEISMSRKYVLFIVKNNRKEKKNAVRALQNSLKNDSSDIK